MARRADLSRFYRLMRRLERGIGGRRLLGQLENRDCPDRGVYFFFENGERRSGSGNGDRVVRVGSHALNAGETTSLWDRLHDHRGAGQPRQRQSGSVFRNRVGNAICRRNRALGPTDWPDDADRGDVVRIERLISRHMWPMPLIFVPVNHRVHRKYIERNAIALLTEYGEENPVDPQSGRWLGRRCGTEKVRESGLWQSEYVDWYHQPKFLDLLEAYVKRAS